MTKALYRKAIAYLRVSTDEQADKGLGLEAQRTAIEAAATNLSVRIVSWHSDEGLSGALDIESRPGLRAAVDSLRRGWVLLIAESSRLARDPDIAGEVRMQVRRKRAVILSAKATENGGNDAVGIMTRRMTDLIAEQYRLAVRERTQAAMDAKQARGERRSRFAPFGFRFTSDDRVVPDQHEQEAIRLMHELRGQGLSFRDIASIAARRGFLGRNGRPLSHGVVRKALLVRARAA